MAKFANKLRAVLSLMCLDLPSADDASETEDHELQVRRCNRKQPADTPHYPENTLMGLPVELRALIYKFALQDVVDTIVHQAPALSYHSTLENFMDRSTDRRLSAITPCRNSLKPAPRLGGLALPCTSRVLRKESLDVYGPLVKAHHERLWERYIGSQNMGQQLPVPEQNCLLDVEIDAYLHWRAVRCLQRVVNCMYVNDCYVRGYHGELYTEAKESEWRARV